VNGVTGLLYRKAALMAAAALLSFVWNMWA
jgi:hypothetical protein